MAFSQLEQDVLAAHEVAIFEDRIILDARPPIDDETLARIQARCAGPIPDGLVRLWRTTFGGRIDYDLQVVFGDHEAGFSFCELFYPDSDGYRDLWGWIEYEEDSLGEDLEEEDEDDEEEWERPKLEYLPFGGFEYLDRLYVKVSPGPDHGAVFAWMRGLPPAWQLRLHEDSVAWVAKDIPDLFRQLVLEENPFGGSEDYDSGLEIIEVIDEIAAFDEVGQTAAEKLRSLLSASVLDWRGAVESGQVVNEKRLRHLALKDAAGRDDVELVERLSAMGCSLSEKIGGGGNLLDHALMKGARRLARFLLDQNVPVTDAIRTGATKATPELVKELLSRGAEPDPIAVMTAIQFGHLDGALLIAEALLKANPASAASLVDEARRRADDQEKTASQIESGKLFSDQTPLEYLERAGRYRRFCERIESMSPNEDSGTL